MRIQEGPQAIFLPIRSVDSNLNANDRERGTPKHANTETPSGRSPFLLVPTADVGGRPGRTKRQERSVTNTVRALYPHPTSSAGGLIGRKLVDEEWRFGDVLIRQGGTVESWVGREDIEFRWLRCRCMIWYGRPPRPRKKALSTSFTAEDGEGCHRL